MNDTSDAISKIVLERYRSMTPAERWLAASSLFETARAIIQSSLPSSLTDEQRRLAIVQRLYNEELPEAALIAHAKYAHARDRTTEIAGLARDSSSQTFSDASMSAPISGAE
jgi:hypothetical protein